ncbi:hypothetical protein SAMN05216571_101394 [Onishia taeanensis]|uniref:Uncharacterized protein n=2 Tax=Onishia taeanensis TaxID=284577 RepID=A0A1G7NEQ9_9GAMM|nr:hypothetical protein SAMN05216571_101394 [Halomonas taeanensis]
MGETPYLMAFEEVEKNSEDHVVAQRKMHDFTMKLDILNEMHEKADEVRRLINLYSGKNKQLFQLRASQFLEKPENKSLLPQDVNATLYLVIAKAFFPFTVFGQGKEISSAMPRLMNGLDQDKLDEFVLSLEQSSFLPTLHRDCIKLYPRIFYAELPLRPALFLDMTRHAGTEKVATKISSQDFLTLKDLYKDIIEVVNRQLVLVAGLNNLQHRGGADSFKAIDGGSLSSLRKFSEKTLSNKFKYLDDCWFNLSGEVFNLGLRNAIAHNNIDYDVSSQVITYYPEGGRLEEPIARKMVFLDFMQLLLDSFREMHNLNHVMKSILYYKYLVYDRRYSSSGD